MPPRGPPLRKTRERKVKRGAVIGACQALKCPYCPQICTVVIHSKQSRNWPNHAKSIHKIPQANSKPTSRAESEYTPAKWSVFVLFFNSDSIFEIKETYFLMGYCRWHCTGECTDKLNHRFLLDEEDRERNFWVISSMMRNLNKNRCVRIDVLRRRRPKMEVYLSARMDLLSAQGWNMWPLDWSVGSPNPLRHLARF